jgi:glycosyltransferase involved in cell wall biosynthesis
MQEDPQLSVVMAALDAEATIEESVQSALSQTEERLEVIVVDDGSRVPVSDVLRHVQDPRLRVIRHPVNGGVAAARNTGLRAARGPFLAQLDADDRWVSDYAATVLPRFADPAVGLVYGNAWIIGRSEREESYILDSSVHPMDTFPKVAEQNPVPSFTATMRTAAVRAVGGYATWMKYAVDYELYTKLIVAGWRFAYVDQHLGWYRWPEPTRGMGFDYQAVDRDVLRMWLRFTLSHPRVPGPRRQIRVGLQREARSLPTRFRA